MTPENIALVTGAAGGIGRAITEKLLREGYTVCGTDSIYFKENRLNENQLKEFEALPLSRANQFFYLPMDVTDIRSIQQVEQEISAREKQVAILINNAGVFENQKLAEISEKSFEKILNVNLLGAFRTTQIFSQGMIRRKQGKIINISSISGSKGAPFASHYAASKGGLTAFSLSLAAELAPDNIQVNVISPGFIDTPMMSGYRETMKIFASWKIPAKRLGLPWEIAEAVWHLASAQGTYMTGATLVIDGGLTLG